MILNNKTYNVFIQARMTSTRLPGKMSMSLLNYPIIEWVIRRSNKSELINEVVLLVPDKKESNYFNYLENKYQIKILRGSEKNVIKRFYKALKKFPCNAFIRVCADNPLITGSEIDRLILLFDKHNFDYSFNHTPILNNNYIDGVGAEIIKSSTFKNYFAKVESSSHKEHVTKYIWDNKKYFNTYLIKAPKAFSYPEISLDVDTISDFKYLEYYLGIYVKKYGLKVPEKIDVTKLISIINE